MALPAEAGGRRAVGGGARAGGPALREDVLPEDPYSGDPALDFGWNAYSGSGDVTAEVVYANHGTKQDFARLAELGVDVAGKIVVARYGGNFRGYKAKFAEQAGAAGLVMYLDPKDYGYVRGLMWPQGGWANGSTIQRGALLTLPYPGDPLTPFVPATVPPAADGALPEGAGRLDPAAVAFPTLPVQPVGWAGAREILSRMQGAAVPAEWQGGLPFNYRLTGGAGLRLHLKVEQERRLVHTANVVATLRGERLPGRDGDRRLPPRRLVVRRRRPEFRLDRGAGGGARLRRGGAPGPPPGPHAGVRPLGGGGVRHPGLGRVGGGPRRRAGRRRGGLPQPRHGLDGTALRRLGHAVAGTAAGRRQPRRRVAGGGRRQRLRRVERPRRR